MINTRRKGKILELRIKKELESQGYKVTQAPGSTKWNKCVDLFSMFDLIGLCKTHKVFIQSKCKGISIKGEKEKLETFHKEYLMDSDLSQLWVYQGRNVWKLYVFNGTTWQEVDYRISVIKR